jgi:hypothetical protein
MAVDEQRLRQSLHTRLVEALGSDEAALLMEYLPPVGWADVARRSDVEGLGRELRTEIAACRNDIEGLGRELRTEIRADIADLKSQLLMWLVPTVIGSVGVAVTLSRVA